MLDTAKITPACAALSILSIGAVLAETALEKAAAEGQRFTAEEVSVKIVGHTITGRAEG